MVYLDLFCFILIGSYAFILLRGNDSALIVGTVMFILSICATLYGPAVTSSIPQIVEEEKLTSANGIINQVGSIVNFVGPILAGLTLWIFRNKNNCNNKCSKLFNFCNNGNVLRYSRCSKR